MVESSDSPPSIVELGSQSSAELAIRAEQTWAEAGERLRGVNATEKFIELKERELQKWVLIQMTLFCYTRSAAHVLAHHGSPLPLIYSSIAALQHVVAHHH
jgi:hypothetical protein